MKYFKVMKFSNLLSLASIIFAIWYFAVWAQMAMELSSNSYSREYGLWSYLTVFSFFILKLSPGILAFHYGYRLLRHKKQANFRRLIGMFTVFAMVVFAGKISLMIDGILPDDIKPLFVLLLCMLTGIPVYMRTVAFFLRREGLPFESYDNVIGKWPFVIMAFQLGLLLFALFEYYGLLLDNLINTQGNAHGKYVDWKMFVSIITLLLSILIPAMLYSYTIKRLGLGKTRVKNSTPAPQLNETSKAV